MATAPISLQGFPALRHMLRTAPRDVIPLAEAALVEEAQVIFRRSQMLVPVQTGALKSSGTVSEPKREGSTVSVELGYGGAAAGYAMFVHEFPPDRAFHQPPTQYKYLSRPVEERQPDIERNMAKRIENMIQKALADGQTRQSEGQ